MPRKVTFAYYSPEIASSRLRAEIPQQELEKYGVGKGMDVLVYGKHLVPMPTVKKFGQAVYDICDDHFHTPELEKYYREHAANADLITCNSEVMKTIILKETGRDAVVIPEPYESEEREPAIGDLLYWFGHSSNAQDIERLYPQLNGREIVVLTNPEWTREKHNEVMSLPLIVVIPTGKSMAKSENRMVEAIRQGKYVCAEYLPSYEPFSQFFPLFDIPSHIEWALNNQAEALERIRHAQDYVRDRYSPAAIGKKWMEALNGIDDLR